MSAHATILILYTTKYRLCGAQMEVAARWMATQKRDQCPEAAVRTVRIESKADFLRAIRSTDGAISELHFIGHSGLYGPMFGTTQRPDQMSRAEWAHLEIAFAPEAEAHFHCCRSARWFAPYFARRYGVPTYGYHSYTTFSRSPEVYVRVPENADGASADGTAIYIVSVPGLKGMGIRGALRKRLGKCPTFPMTRFEPTAADGDDSYDGVAELYDAVFEDFRVRADEWKWLSRNLPRGGRVLDIGCGNGALLLALATLIDEGTGVDRSERMIDIARRRARMEPNLRFEPIDGPVLPFPVASFDAIISMLSWRYLDWDPMVAEILRVLRPGGRVLIVDMAVSPFRWRAIGRVLNDKVRTASTGLGKPAFRRSLSNLVNDPGWTTLLRHNPMRAQHEYRWYLPSRFPGGRFETLNLSPRSEILAFRWDDDRASAAASICTAVDEVCPQ